METRTRTRAEDCHKVRGATGFLSSYRTRSKTILRAAGSIQRAAWWDKQGLKPSWIATIICQNGRANTGRYHASASGTEQMERSGGRTTANGRRGGSCRRRKIANTGTRTTTGKRHKSLGSTGVITAC